MRVFLLLALVVGAVAVTGCGSEPEGVVIPEPSSGNEYSITELCGHLNAEGYDVGGSVGYTLTADELGFLDDLPGLVRGAAEVAIGDGLRVELNLQGLCRYTG